MLFFREELRKDCTDRVKRIYFYFTKFKYATSRIRIEKSNASGLSDQVLNWRESICRKVTDILPDHALYSLITRVTTISYYSVNLFHNVLVPGK